jgi:hypothetical protein
LKAFSLLTIITLLGLYSAGPATPSFAAWPAGSRGAAQPGSASIAWAHESPSAQRPSHDRFQIVTIQELAGLARPTRAPRLFFRGGVRPHAATTTGSGARTSAAASSPAAANVALYNTLNKPGISASSNSHLVAPPDSTGAIGPNHYVEMANSIIHVWDRNLNSVSSASLASFVGLPSDPFCDPQVQWDPAAGRWLFVTLFCDLQATVQFFVFGWSKTSNPSNLVSGWCHFAIKTNSLIFDYPKLGHNSKYLIIGGNFYNVADPGNPFFVGAAIAWAALPAKGSTSCVSPTFHGTQNALINGDGQTSTFTPVPVNTDSSTSDGYVLSAYDPAGNTIEAPGPQQLLAVWRVDSSGVLHQEPDILVGSYSAPLAAPQAGAPHYTLDTLDGRLTQAVGDPTTGIWTQHTVGGGAGSRVFWYELALQGGILTKVQEGQITSATDYVFNAAISPSFGAHGAAIFYNRSSSTIDPVVAAQVRTGATPLNAMAPGELILATSPAPDTDFSCPPCRWGDYSAATPDPVQPYVVWGTNEFNTASTVSTGGAPAWLDENFAVAAAVAPGAPTNVKATMSSALACVAWDLSTLDDGGAPDLSYTIKVYQAGLPVRSDTVSAPATTSCLGDLRRGVTYTFTVTATNIAGSSPESGPSQPLIFGLAVSQSTALPSPDRLGVNQSAPVP